MMDTLENLWDRIDTALQSQKPEVIMEIVDQAINQGKKEKKDQHEFYYAAGYIAYMHPEGRLNSFIRKKATDAFLLSLLYRPGFLPSVLYLVFIKMDENRFIDALELLYSYDGRIDSFDHQLVDRYFEAKVCCLIECGFWVNALKELKWFDIRMKEDSQVGIDLINFMKIKEKINPETKIEKDVINKIKYILRN